MSKDRNYEIVTRDNSYNNKPDWKQNVASKTQKRNSVKKCILLCVFSVVYYMFVGSFIASVTNSITATLIIDCSIIFFGIFYYNNYIRTKFLSSFDVTKDAKTWIKLCLATFVVWMVTQSIVAYYMMYFDDNGFGNLHHSTVNNVSTCMPLTLIIAPIAEEILFRGVIYANLKKHIHIGIAALISAVLFSACHGTIVNALLGFVCGMFFVAVYECFDELSIAVLMHILYNFFTSKFECVTIFCCSLQVVVVSNVLIIIAILAFLIKHKKKFD